MSCWIRNNQYKIKNRYPIQFDEIEKFQFVELRKSRFVCEKPINKRMLICIACGNGSFEYRIELSKTRRQRLC